MILSKSIGCIAFCLVQLTFGRATAGESLKAFPSAVGFGQGVAGGRGGEVRLVTNLDDAGEGSLRSAWERPGRAYIVFNVAGYVVTASSISPSDEKTIFGQSAFRAGGHGITLRGNGKYPNPLVAGAFGKQSVRHLRFRRGRGVQNECCGDNVEPHEGVGQLIFDHCSFSWSTDENLSFSSSPTYTVQYCLIAEALHFATHQYSTPGNPNYPSPHSMGSLNAYAQTDMSWYGNYFVHNNQRNALFSQFTLPDTRIEYVNNLCYNWGMFGNCYAYGDDTNFRVNIVNNRAKKGPSTSKIRYFFSVPTNSKNRRHQFYVSGNITDKRPLGSEPEWAAIADWSSNVEADTEFKVDAPFKYPLQSLDLIKAGELPGKLLPHVGASLFRDAVDQRVVRDYQHGTGGFVNDPEDVGGYPQLSPVSSDLNDADGDGMDDDWETENGVDSPNDMIENYVINGEVWTNPGYEAIEVFYFTAFDKSGLKAGN